MANVTLDNGDLSDVPISATTLADGSHVQGIELVSAVEGGARTKLAWAIDEAYVAGSRGLVLIGVRKDSPAALGATDGDLVPLIFDSSGRLHIAPLAPGTNAIGTVEVTKITPGVGGTDLAKAEDAAHASGDAGVAFWAVRKDSATALAGTDGDYAPLEVDANGRLHVNVGAMPAAARTTDSIGAALQTDAIMNGLTALTPKFKSLTVAASQTDASVVAAVASKKIRVLAASYQCAGTGTTVTLESDEGSDVRLDKVPAGANGGKVLPFSPTGWFETAAGSALLATTGAGSDTEITLAYLEV